MLAHEFMMEAVVSVMDALRSGKISSQTPNYVVLMKVMGEMSLDPLDNIIVLPDEELEIASAAVHSDETYELADNKEALNSLMRNLA